MQSMLLQLWYGGDLSASRMARDGVIMVYEAVRKY